MTDFKILSRPTISRATFVRILHENDSPAAGSAEQAWANIIAYGVDPAFELAMFLHESSYGRKGAAVSRRNWGNLRRSPYFKSFKGFAKYPTWAAGAGDTARLLRIYGLDLIRPPRHTSTARTLPFVWAPAKDHNKPAAYGQALVDAMVRYHRRERAWNPKGPNAAAPLSHPNAHPTVLPALAPGVTRYRTSFRGCRIRTAPNLTASIVKVAPVGLVIGAAGVVNGAPYSANGPSSRSWLKVVEIGGVRLQRPVFTARLFWHPV